MDSVVELRSVISSGDALEIVLRYIVNGSSPGDLSREFPYRRTTIEACIQRFGVLRNRIEASKLAAQQGKKDKAIAALIGSAKTDNRFHPAKRHTLEKHPRWIVDRSKVKRRDRGLAEERDFIRRMLEKRGFCCELTGKQGRLSVHHVRPVWQFPEERFNEQNACVILYVIHRFFHRLYGWKATKSDWDAFLLKEEYYNAYSQ